MERGDALSVSMDMGTDDLKVRSNRAFKQVARNAESSHAAAEREAADQAIRDKTERLKALRLEKEAAERLRSSGKVLCHEHRRSKRWCATVRRDEGGPFEVGNQVLISSHRKLLSSKAMVVNVAEKSGHDPGRRG